VCARYFVNLKTNTFQLKKTIILCSFMFPAKENKKSHLQLSNLQCCLFDIVILKGTIISNVRNVRLQRRHWPTDNVVIYFVLAKMIKKHNNRDLPWRDLLDLHRWTSASAFPICQSHSKYPVEFTSQSIASRQDTVSLVRLCNNNRTVMGLDPQAFKDKDSRKKIQGQG